MFPPTSAITKVSVSPRIFLPKDSPDSEKKIECKDPKTSESWLYTDNTQTLYHTFPCFKDAVGNAL